MPTLRVSFLLSKFSSTSNGRSSPAIPVSTRIAQSADCKLAQLSGGSGSVTGVLKNMKQRLNMITATQYDRRRTTCPSVHIGQCFSRIPCPRHKFPAHCFSPGRSNDMNLRIATKMNERQMYDNNNQYICNSTETYPANIIISRYQKNVKLLRPFFEKISARLAHAPVAWAMTFTLGIFLL